MANRGQEKLTLLLIPHSARPVATLRVNSQVLQVCCVVLIILFMSLTVFAARYTQMVAHLNELRDLRTVSQMQEEQLRELTLSATELQDRLQQLARLDGEIRTLLKLSEPQPASTMDALLLADSQVGVAGAAVGGGVTVGADQPLSVTTSTLTLSGLLAGTLDLLQQEMEQRLVSLQEVQIAAAEKVAYEAAKPALWPVEGIVSSRYGYRPDPFGAYRQFHPAYDIAAPLGTPILATGDARVASTGWKSDLGNTVILDHGYNLRTLYGHVAKIVVSVGDRVKRGQIIAYVGTTGQSTGPHVHYEVQLRGTPVNPKGYLP